MPDIDACCVVHHGPTINFFVARHATDLFIVSMHDVTVERQQQQQRTVWFVSPDVVVPSVAAALPACVENQT